MRILVDTNVVMDILLKREPFFHDSYAALKRAITDDVECLVSATAATDIYYLLRKGLKDAAKAREAMERLLQLVAMADVLALDIQTALSDRLPDFEDAVVTAVAARNKADYILTRNIRDFYGAAVSVITPHEFLGLPAE